MNFSIVVITGVRPPNYLEEMKGLIETIMPVMDCKSKKGDAGRVAVIGGSFEYTGAPYFSAMAAMKSVLYLLLDFS